MVRGLKKLEMRGVQAVTVNINGDSSCGINVAHLEGQSREETAAQKGNDEEEIPVDRQERRGEEEEIEEVCLT